MIGLLSKGRSGEHVFFRVQFAVKNGVVERKVQRDSIVFVGSEGR